MRVCRVQPDVPAVRRAFDYLVPDELSASVRVGTVVRVPLHGRRVRGWVLDADVAPDAIDAPAARLQQLRAVSSDGPPADVVADMMRFNGELAQAGVLLALDGLTHPEDGACVRYAGGRPSVTDGPFTEAKELVGGYWVIQASSKEEAVQWAARCPARDGDVIEVRPIQRAPGDD